MTTTPDNLTDVLTVTASQSGAGTSTASIELASDYEILGVWGTVYGNGGDPGDPVEARLLRSNPSDTNNHGVFGLNLTLSGAAGAAQGSASGSAPAQWHARARTVLTARVRVLAGGDAEATFWLSVRRRA